MKPRGSTVTNRTTTHAPSGWLAVVLPLLVGIIPLVILHAEADGLISLARESAVQKWLATVRPLAERYRERASPEFWLEDSLRQVTTGLHCGTPWASVSHTLSSAISSLHRRGFSGLQAWAAVKDPVNPSAPFALLEGRNLRSDFRVFFRGLLRELASEAGGTARTGGTESWTSRLRATFGDGVPTELFTGAWRGRAFFITFRHQFGLAAWDALRDRTGATSGAVFLFWPLDLDFARRGVELAIRHWKSISPSPAFVPAAIDLPAPGTRHRRRILLPSTLAADMQARQSLRSLGRRLKATPISSKAFEALQTPRIGEIDLKALDIPITDGPAWLYPLPLPPLSGHAGVIVSPAPAIPLPTVAHLRNAGAVILTAAFLFLAAMVATGRALPSFSVRSTLLFWLLVLAAIPAALLLAAQERLAADRASNRRTELRSTLHRHLERIDSGSASITQAFLQTCRGILRSPSLPAELDTAALTHEAGNIILDTIESRCASSGMELSGIFIFGHGGFKLTRVSPSVSPDTAGRLVWYHEFLAAETLTRIAPQIARESEATTKRRKSSAAEMGNLDIVSKNENFLGPADAACTYRLGNRHTLRYYDFVFHRGGARYMIFIMWAQDRVYRTYLSESLTRLNRENPNLGVCAFRRHGSSLKLESAAATPGQIGNISLAARNLPDTKESLSETVLFKGKTMPEYTLGITAPLDPILREQSNDLVRSLLIFFCMFALLVGAGVLLSAWLAEPVQRMSEALRRVSADDLETRVHIERADELGSTAGTLDTMIGWLRERRAMSRFVSSQVLDVVSGGNLSGRTDATRSQAALLVTDVRSFTTLSESHPAPEIFSMLNAHLAAMTAIIQKHGGSIDRFIGDAIQAVFLPDTAGRPVDHALLAGHEMMQAHRRLQDERRKRGAFTYGIGVGIDQGEVVTGILGDPQVRLDFTVLGEPLKHAADLESLSKGGRHTLVITSDAVKHAASGDFVFEPLPSTSGEHGESVWELVTVRPGDGIQDLNIRQDADPPAGHVDVPEHPQPASPPMPETHTTARPSGISAVSIAIALVLWVTPLLLMLTASRDLDASSRDAIGSRVRSQLRQDLQFAEQTTDSHVLSLLLMQQIVAPVMSVDCGTPASRRIIRNRISQLRNLFPGLRCAFTFGRSGSDDPPAGFTYGKPHIFTLDEWKDVFQIFRGEIQSFSYPTAPGHDQKWMRKRFSQTNMWGAMKEGFGRFLKIPVRSRDVLFTWFPLFGSDPSSGCPVSTAAIEANFGRKNLFLPRIRGALFLTITPDRLTADSGKTSLVRLLSHRGCAVALLPVSDASGAICHPLFRSDRELSAYLTDPSPARTRWEIQEGEVTLDHRYRIIAARRSGPATPDADNRPPLYWLATAIWLLFGQIGAKLWRDAATGRKLPGLQMQLTVAFVFVLLPFLFLGFLSLERTAGEQSLSQSNSSISTLRETLEATDRHREYIQAWAASVMSRLSTRRRLHEELAAAELRRPKADDLSLNPIVRAEATRLARWGLLASTPMITGLDGFFLAFFGDIHLSKIALLTNLMRFLSARILDSLNTGPARSSKSAQGFGKDLLIGVGMEESQQLLMAATPADGLCRFLVAPNDMSSIALFTMADTLVRFMIRSNGFMRWIFLVNFKPHSFDTQALLSSAPSRSAPAPVRVGFADRLEPMLFFAPPFYTIERKSDGEVDVRNIYDSLAPSLMTMSAATLNAGVSTTLAVGRASEERTIMSFLPTRMAGKILFAEIPSGKQRATAETDMNRRRGVLFAMLLFSILLARHVSARFLQPLLALSDAAGRIMSRDFTVRLPVVRRDEFGELASSFNSMAQGVEEGRLLSRFVSESVRTAARDTGREEAARRGEQTEAAVLFAGLGNFKSVLAGTDAALLVPQLNRYLEVMSQVVRDHRGDIDKFIGEKVLAVFFPDRLGGRSQAADAALRAAIAMQERMADLRSVFDLPLGVGVVHGPLLAGIMGAPQVRLEYTVIGDTVNLASRLSDIAMRLGPDGSIRESAVGAAGGIVFEAGLGRILPSEPGDLLRLLKPLDLPPIKGKIRSVDAYRIDVPHRG